MRLAILIVVIAVCICAPAKSTTFVIDPDGSGDFPTIQDAINEAEDGDIIELADGTFTGAGNRDVDYHGKALTIQSQGGDPAMCTIDCDGSEAEPHRGFHFTSGETVASVLEGVTITGGYIHVYGMPSESSGGAIRCFVSSPMIRNCRFVGNHASHRGGAVYCDECSPTIDVCVFESNTADWGSGLGCGYYAHPEVTGCVFRGNGDCYGGGGIFCGTTSPQIRDCTFVDNSARNHGGAIWCGGEECPLVSGCTMIGNSAPNGGGVFRSEQSGCILMLMNCIVAFNDGEGVGGLWVTPICCDIYGNTGGDYVGYIENELGINGNICEDPLVCDLEGQDFHLQEDSPCAPFTPPNEECDLIGAWPVGCGPTDVRMGTWGSIKAMYRR